MNHFADAGKTNPIQTQFQIRMTNDEVQMRVKVGRKIADFRQTKTA